MPCKHNLSASLLILAFTFLLGACASQDVGPAAVGPSAIESEATSTREAQSWALTRTPPHDPELGTPVPAAQSSRDDPTEIEQAGAHTLTPTPVQTIEEAGGSSSGIVVNHRDVAAFDSIPPEYLIAASQLRMIYIDRSVGKNIDDALNCLSYPSTGSAPNHCSRLDHPRSEFEVDPSVVEWSRAGGYDRSRWEFATWSGEGCAQWYEKIDCFFEMMDSKMERYDVVSYQLSYLAVNPGSSINDPQGGYFADNPDRTDVHDQMEFEAGYSDTTFIYWTTSLARGIGSQESDEFNQSMREFASEHGKVLFDVADILSHDPAGNPCFDNRDGIPYDNGNRSEDHPDDGKQHLAICPHYTTEIEGGHLGSVAAGKIRVAKAFWVLMARIAGWG